MMAVLKWTAIAAGLVAGLVFFVSAAVYLASEAMLVRRFTLPSSIIHAATQPADIAWGEHLSTIFGCRDCHGAHLRGRLMSISPGLMIAAPNLRRFAASATDADFDRAVRHGLAPSARALWVMPSAAYVYMRDSDLADIVGYIRSLPPAGPAWLEPHFSLQARLAVLTGKLSPVDPYDLGRYPPLNVGPHWDGGRYLAAMACSSCHATDLTGSGTAPDLKIVASYSRSQFFALVRTGQAPARHHAPAMAQLAKTRFSAFKDYEIDALYSYLVERTHAPSPAPAVEHR